MNDKNNYYFQDENKYVIYGLCGIIFLPILIVVSIIYFIWTLFSTLGEFVSACAWSVQYNIEARKSK